MIDYTKPFFCPSCGHPCTGWIGPEGYSTQCDRPECAAMFALDAHPHPFLLSEEELDALLSG